MNTPKTEHALKLLADPNVASVEVINSVDGKTWTSRSAWTDAAGDLVVGHDLDADGQTYTVTVETLSTASVVVRASSPDAALAWAKSHAEADGLMVDNLPEYDWPTAKVVPQ